jgi:hypothetical protein
MKILDVIRETGQSVGFECLSSEAYNLDFERYQETAEPLEHRVEDIFEYPKLENGKKRLKDIPIDVPTILRYFLDGSRRTYKIGDIIFDGRSYYPLVAGQIGVAVLNRSENNKIKPLKNYCLIKHVLAFPDRLPKHDLPVFEENIREVFSNIKIELLRYKVEQGKDLIDLAVAKIMAEMINCEIKIVQQMANNNLLSTDQMLVIDGPLRFTQRLDLTQFSNVIGISKTFRPTFNLI